MSIHDSSFDGHRRMRRWGDVRSSEDDIDWGSISHSGSDISGFSVTAEDRHAYERGGFLRRFTFLMVDSAVFKGIILTVILLNTVIITLQTIRSIRQVTGWYFGMIDNIFLGIYIFELIAKIFVFRRKFFYSGWNLLDFSIVVLSFVEYLEFVISLILVLNPRIFRLLRIFRAVRALRALRVLRTISFLKHLQIIVATLLSSIPALGSIVLLLTLILYIFAIIGRSLYANVAPERFGSLWLSFFSLFQLITLDDWFEFYTDVKDKDPTILIYLVVFIILETFIFINLFIAVLVNNLTAASKEGPRRQKKKVSPIDAAVLAPPEEEPVGNVSVSNFGDSASVHKPVDKDFDFYYGDDAPVSAREKELVSEYFQLLASLENEAAQHDVQQRLLDDLVDLTDGRSDPMHSMHS